MSHRHPNAFSCQRCGNCCRHAGEVRLAAGESEAIAACLGMGMEEFTDHFTRLRDDRRGLRLKDRADGACVFLDDSPVACRIQGAKPRQCRDFPIGWKYDNLEEVCQAMQRPGGPRLACDATQPAIGPMNSNRFRLQEGTGS